jgi:DNA-binding MarR family transcriptional regulator
VIFERIPDLSTRSGSKRRAKLAAAAAPKVQRGVSQVYRLLAASLPRGPLSRAKLSALMSLMRGGPTNAGTLSQRMTIRPQSLTRILVALEREGLVSRTRAAEDAREHILHLSAQGRERVLAERERRDELMREVMQHALTRTEIELLAIAGRILEKLADRWTTFTDTNPHLSAGD